MGHNAKLFYINPLFSLTIPSVLSLPPSFRIFPCKLPSQPGVLGFKGHFQ